MFERYIQDLRTDDPGAETPAATRERLKTKFAPGASRRMTLLGLMVGSTLQDLVQEGDDTLVYASTYGESPALESFLESFPAASPTLFQTSIHPSGVQQALIGRQRAVREVLPFAGGAGIVAQAALAALLATAPRVLWCGGDERGSWLREAGVASERSYAFALALTHERTANSLGRIALVPGGAGEALALPAWCDLLRTRQSWRGAAGGGWDLQLDWL